jgi:hypothetical protein
MANDPAFLFYPGDYLRDTQCLSEPSQVAYDRIMCEHMRNICISQSQLKFFTKRLTDEQKEELMMVLTENTEGFFISWVVDSIQKRRAYSESRRNNRKSSPVKPDKKQEKMSLTYDEHMDNENEIVIDKELLGSIMSFFNFNEIANFDKMQDIGVFLRCLEFSKRTEYFKIQFAAYCEIKNKDPKFKHSFKNFIGTTKELHEDGAWNSEVWTEKLNPVVKQERRLVN